MVDDLQGQRRKLLGLFYDDRIGADLFAEEEVRLTVAIQAAQRESDVCQAEADRSDDVARHFDEVAKVLAALDVGGSDIMPWAFLMPPRPGDQPMSERDSVAIRCARWEPPNFAYRLRNSSGQAHVADQNPY